MKEEFYKAASNIDDVVEHLGPAQIAELEKKFKVKGAWEYFVREKLPNVDNVLDWLDALKDRGYFAGDRNPRPQEVKDQPGCYTIPFWNVLPFLEKVAEENKNNPTPEITDALVEIIDGIIQYRDEKDQRIDNYRTDWFMTKIIFKLPAEKWNDKHIDFVRIAVKSPFGGDLVENAIGEIMLSELIQNSKKDLILRLLNIMLDYERTGKGGRKEIEPIVKKYWIKDALLKHTEGIVKLCGAEAARIGIEKIKGLIKEEDGRFSYTWIPTIEESLQSRSWDSYEDHLINFVRDILEKCNEGEAKSLTEELLQEEDEVFKRIAVHTVNKRYGLLKDMFWNYKGNLYEAAQHEVYELLKGHCKELDEAEISRVIKWVDEIEYTNIEEENRRRAEAWKRKELLSALLESGDARVRALYNKYDEIAPGKLEHPGFPVWSESGCVEDVSPVEFSEVIKWPNEKIAEYLREYKQEKPEWGLRRVSTQGLMICFRKCVRENPEKFATDLRAFLSVPQIYQNELLNGFNDAWEAKKEFTIEKVLDYIEALLGSDEFWNEKYGNKQYNYRNGIISQMAEFIEGGTKNDDHAFDAKCLPQIEKILLGLVQKAESRIRDTRRIVDMLLVSPRANVFSAMVNYSLRCARLSGKKEGIKWPNAIRDEFTKRVDRTVEGSLDFALTVTQYLPNLMYLDKEWVFANIERIFAIEDEERWKVVFGGYLEYSQHVYEEFYGFLREKGHYRKAIETEFEDKYIVEKLVQHVAIGFLEGWEDVDNPESLIAFLLRRKDPEQLSELIGFLNTIKEGEPRKNLEAKIKSLWGALFGLLGKEQGKKEYQHVISKLHMWVGIVPVIDEDVKNWAKLTAKYIGIDWNGDGLVEYLAKHVDKTPQNVGEIYVTMLENGTYPDIGKKDIIRIIQSLYEHGEEKIADTICNMYGEVGLYFLREIYEVHHKKD
jgi:hypothetical protein